MPIDASIPLKAKNIQLESPVNQLVMLSEATKLGEMNRSIGEQNQLNEYLRSGVDLSSAEGKRGLLNYGKTGIAHAKAVSDIEKSGLETKKLGYEAKAKQLDVQREQFANLVFNPSDANITAHLQDSVLKGELPQAQAGQLLQKVMGMNLDQRKQFFTDMGMKATERANLAETTRSHKVNEGIAGGNLAVAQQTLANANNPTLQGNLAAARAGGTEAGKATAQAAIALPGAVATGEEAIRKIDALVGALPVKNAEGKIVQAGTKPHAGFGQSVGFGIPGLKYIPGTSAADFNARLNEVQGGAFLQAFNTLKGGGSITETEGTKATQAINRMSTAQSEKEFNTAAREYQDVIRTGIARAKAKAANAGGGGVPVGRGGSAPAAGGEIDFNSLK